jgi:peroxiredoxin (alkyl hydroperoxide reductase subunit C)
MSVLVGKLAPDFTAAAVMPNNEIDENFNLHSYIKGRIGILFFYPLDFTFVCPSEIIAFANRIKDFKDRGAELIGISVDSKYTHLAWKNTEVKKASSYCSRWHKCCENVRNFSCVNCPCFFNT